MKYSRYDLIEFDDGSEYMVVDSLVRNDDTYVFLINPDDEMDAFIVKEEKDGLKRLPKGNEYDLISMEILKRNKDEVDKILEGIE